MVPVHARQKSMDFKTLIETGRNWEIKFNKRIAKKKTFSLFSDVSIIHGRTAVTFYQASLSGTSL